MKTLFASQITIGRPRAKNISGLLPRCVYRPQPWIDRNPYDLAARVAIDVQAVLSRPGNFEFVRRHGGQQSRAPHGQVITGVGVPGQLDLERGSLAPYLRNRVR
jgi:hypothetical protein